VSEPLTLVLKTETNPHKKIVCLTLINVDTGDIFDFFNAAPVGGLVCHGSIALGASILADPSVSVISHSEYHRKVIAHEFGIDIDDERFTDTIAMAKLALGDGMDHGLSAWSARLGHSARVAPSRRLDWTYGAQMRCHNDAHIVFDLFNHLEDIVAARAVAREVGADVNLF